MLFVTFHFCDIDFFFSISTIWLCVDATYSGGGLPFASHLIVIKLSNGSAMMGPDV